MASATKLTSFKRLLLLLVLATAFFIFIRWDLSPWMSAKISDLAAENGLELHYENLNMSGLGLRFEQVQIKRAGSAPVTLTSLKLSPAWSYLSSGTPALNVKAMWQDNPILFTVSQQDSHITIEAMDATIQAADLLAMQHIPAKASGNLHLTGALQIDPDTQKIFPIQIQIDGHALQAGLNGPEFILGDYVLHLQSDVQAAQPWAWDISGGSSIVLEGNGLLSTSNPDPMLWQISGQARLSVDNSQPVLTMMVKALTGKSTSSIRLSGSISSPRAVILN